MKAHKILYKCYKICGGFVVVVCAVFTDSVPGDPETLDLAYSSEFQGQRRAWQGAQHLPANLNCIAAWAH